MEKYVKDAMEKVDSGMPIVERLNMERNQALQSMPMNQQATYLENTEKEHEFWIKQKAYLQNKVKAEANAILEGNQKIAEMEEKIAWKEEELKDLDLREGSEEDEEGWEDIAHFRSRILENPTFATALFDSEFLKDLQNNLTTSSTRSRRRWSVFGIRSSGSQKRPVAKSKNTLTAETSTSGL